MTLDLSKVIGQIGALASQARTDAPAWGESLEKAQAALTAADPSTLARRIESAGVGFAWQGIAGLVGDIGGSYAPSDPPPDFTVVASDGSHIEPERHHPANCFLLNLGAASFRYGQDASAELASEPTLFYGDDLALPITKAGVRREPIEGAILGMKRTVAEAQALAALAEGAPGTSPLLTLLDGTLVVWGLAGRAYSEYVRDEILKAGVLASLDRLRGLGRERRVAVASYISHPGSAEVANALRLQLCPFQSIDCDFNCGQERRKPEDRECLPLDRVIDRHIFQRHLAVGERSATFRSLLPVVQEHYGEHEIRFFYLRLEDEVARIEVPRWVAEDKGLLNLTHALVLDQCRRGLGYPVALSEAHQQAVLTGADREMFWQMVESSLAEAHLPVRTSGKSHSKRRPWL